VARAFLALVRSRGGTKTFMVILYHTPSHVTAARNGVRSWGGHESQVVVGMVATMLLICWNRCAWRSGKGGPQYSVLWKIQQPRVDHAPSQPTLLHIGQKRSSSRTVR
jgi:hypothetical protein